MIQDKSEGDPPWIKLINGAEIWVLGTDAPARLEGVPWDGFVIDEYANMKPDVWESHIFPMVTERHAWAWFLGVPEVGARHYSRLYKRAVAHDLARKAIQDGQPEAAVDILRPMFEGQAVELVERGVDALEWSAFHWLSADILPAKEIAAAKATMSADVYEVEFEGKFTTMKGRVYTSFDASRNCAPLAHLYNPRAPLIFAFDFNVSPGVAGAIQELQLPNGETGTAILGEVFIPDDATTPRICNALIREWEGHGGPIVLHGDASGGSRSMQGDGSSNWRIVNRMMREVFPRVLDHVPDGLPQVLDRVNATNARFLAADGKVRCMVDPIRAPHTVEDLEGVKWLPGTNDLDKRDMALTHLSDAVGYYIEARFPIPDESWQGRRSDVAVS
jgi:hypothetical protein